MVRALCLSVRLSHCNVGGLWSHGGTKKWKWAQTWNCRCLGYLHVQSDQERSILWSEYGKCGSLLTCSSTNLVLVAVMLCATVRRYCDCFIASLAPFINIQTYLLTYYLLCTSAASNDSHVVLYQHLLSFLYLLPVWSITGQLIYRAKLIQNLFSYLLSLHL